MSTLGSSVISARKSVIPASMIFASVSGFVSASTTAVMI